MRTALVAIMTLLLLSSAAAQGQRQTGDRPRFRTCGEGLQWNMILWPQQRCTDFANQQREPAKLFDNVYSVGLQALSAILVSTSDGLVLLDATFAETSDWVLDNIRKVGFDPNDIRYVFITHARADHYGGAGRIKQLVPGARVAMSLEDWEEAEREMRGGRLTSGGAGSKPAPLVRDLVVTDGQRITVGDTTFVIYVSPGTTPGALSIEYPARDGNRRHRAMSSGALGMYPSPEWGKAYIASLQRLKTLGPWQVWLPNHPFMALPLDMADLEKALATRGRGPHPGVARPEQIDEWLDFAVQLARKKMAIEAFAPRLAQWPD
jgi:glyoxylase-like metal-dependent hydrolase (beta-lactamase superfamily II)